jgi:hypothetical protein
MNSARLATTRIEPLVVGAVIALLIALTLFGPPAPRERGIWGSPYYLMVVTLCAAGLAVIAWCGVRYLRRALRTGQMLVRFGLVYRETEPIRFWITLLMAMLMFLFSGVFCVVIALLNLWNVGALG